MLKHWYDALRDGSFSVESVIVLRDRGVGLRTGQFGQRLALG